MESVLLMIMITMRQRGRREEKKKMTMKISTIELIVYAHDGLFQLLYTS